MKKIIVIVLLAVLLPFSKLAAQRFYEETKEAKHWVKRNIINSAKTSV